MENWLRKETFSELDTPSVYLGDVVGLAPDCVLEPLDPSLYVKLYDYFHDRGGQPLHRVNAMGEIELLIFSKDENSPLTEEDPWEIRVEKSQDNEFGFNLLFHDQKNDGPLKFSFTFDLTELTHRYQVAALCEQDEIPIYFLTSQEERLVVSFCRLLSWPDHVRENLRREIKGAYVPIREKNSRKVDTVPASSFPISELISPGWAYSFDKNILVSEYGSFDSALNYLFKCIFGCRDILTGQKNQGTQQGPFLFWVTTGPVGEEGVDSEGIVLFITTTKGESETIKKQGCEPCVEYLSSCTGFLRVDEGYPIFSGAVPAFRYESGNFILISLDPDFFQFGAQLIESMKEEKGINSPNNIYRDLLNKRMMKNNNRSLD